MKIFKIGILSVVADGDEEKIGEILSEEPEERDKMWPEKLAPAPTTYIPGRCDPQQMIGLSVLGGDGTAEQIRRLEGKVAEYKISIDGARKEPLYEKRMVARMQLLDVLEISGKHTFRLLLIELEKYLTT